MHSMFLATHSCHSCHSCTLFFQKVAKHGVRGQTKGQKSRPTAAAKSAWRGEEMDCIARQACARLDWRGTRPMARGVRNGPRTHGDGTDGHELRRLENKCQT